MVFEEYRDRTYALAYHYKNVEVELRFHALITEALNGSQNRYVPP